MMTRIETKITNEKYTVNGRTVRGTDRAAKVAMKENTVAIDCQGIILTPVMECGTWGKPMLVQIIA